MDYGSRIDSLYGDISGLSSSMKKNNENIARLEKAESGITGEQAEMMAQKKAIGEPSLSSETYAGKHAEAFLNRRDNIEREYAYMMNVSVESLLSNITNEISRLRNLNVELGNTIESKRHQISVLRQKAEGE